MKILHIVVFTLAIIILPASKNFLTAGVVAKVNSKEIMSEDVEIFVKQLIERAKAMGQEVTPESEKKLREQWTDHMISRALLMEQAKAYKVVVSDEDVEKSMSNPQYQGLSLSKDKLRELVNGDLMIHGAIESEIMSKVKITDKELEEFYNERKEEMKEPEQVKARHILLKVNETDPQDLKDKQLSKAKEVLKEAKVGKTEFSDLAKKYSEGPSAPNGGDLGYFPRGRMVPSFETAAFALNPNGISDIVETQFGYHIIKVEDKKNARDIPFEEVKEAIRENIKVERGNKGIKEWIDKLRNQAKIEIIE